jgi:hypothetical protein
MIAYTLGVYRAFPLYILAKSNLRDTLTHKPTRMSTPVTGLPLRAGRQHVAPVFPTLLNYGYPLFMILRMYHLFFIFTMPFRRHSEVPGRLKLWHM